MSTWLLLCPLLRLIEQPEVGRLLNLVTAVILTPYVCVFAYGRTTNRSPETQLGGGGGGGVHGDFGDPDGIWSRLLGLFPVFLTYYVKRHWEVWVGRGIDYGRSGVRGGSQWQQCTLCVSLPFPAWTCPWGFLCQCSNASVDLRRLIGAQVANGEVRKKWRKSE